MSFFSNDITGGLFPDWSPEDAVRRVFGAIGVNEDDLLFLGFDYSSFRKCGKRCFSTNVAKSDDLFKMLFSPTTGKTQRDFDFVQYGGPSPGYFGQINLDNIGKDFLCYIYYRQRIEDILEKDPEGLDLVIKDILRRPDKEPEEFTNLNNSLIPVEALFDYLDEKGVFLNSTGRDERVDESSINTDKSLDFLEYEGENDLSLILSDPPQRRLPLSEIPSFGAMLRNTRNLSRYIRSVSVCLQNGGDWEEIRKFRFDKFDLKFRLSLFRDRRYSIGQTDSFVRGVAMNREFCLWDMRRGDRLPSIRRIAEQRKIPYPELLRILKYGATNRETGIHRFEGLEFLTKGFSTRLINTFVEDIKKRTL